MHAGRYSSRLARMYVKSGPTHQEGQIVKKVFWVEMFRAYDVEICKLQQDYLLTNEQCVSF